MKHETEGATRREFVAAGAAAAAAVTFGFNRMARADADAAAPISQIVKFKINMENEEAAIQALRTLTKGVEENEPGVLAYLAHRSTEDPSEVVFFEVYKDQAALQAHGGTPHMMAMRQSFMQNFQPPLDVQAIERISGFTR